LVGLTIGAQPRAARERARFVAARLARLVGCSALILIQPSPCAATDNR
jgi:hypothetical protein